MGSSQLIVLDTHVWVWWASNPEQIAPSARKAIEQAALDNKIFISSISAWEIALLVARGRLKLTLPVKDWLAVSESLSFINFVPVANNIAVRSVQLPGKIHDDPADRIIIATTLSLGGILVTKDEKILHYPHVKTLW